jgi:hypothetical protein
MFPNNQWSKYILPGLLLVLLLAFFYTTYSFSRSIQRLTASIEAREAQASAVTASIDEMEVTVAEAQSAAEQAQAAVESLKSALPPTPAPAELMIPLDGGVAITYQSADDHGMVLYPVDDWWLYKDYDEFRADWDLEGPARVLFALIETQEGAGEWQLLYAKPVADVEAMPTGWSEYALLAGLHPATTEESDAVGEPKWVAGELVFDESPRQKIVASTAFTVATGVTTRDSLDSLRSAGANLPLASRLLLADDSTGEMKYTLIIFDFEFGAGGDWIRRWCSRCREAWCLHFCRRR